MKQAEQQAGIFMTADLLPLNVYKDTNFNYFQSEPYSSWMGSTIFANVSCTAASHMDRVLKVSSSLRRLTY